MPAGSPASLRRLLRTLHGPALLALTASASTLACPVAPDSEATSQSLIMRMQEARIELSASGPVDVYPVRVGGVEHAAIFAPAPSRIRFRALAIPQDAVLTFGAGLIDKRAWRQGKTDRASFEVRVEPMSGRPRTLWSRELRPEDGSSSQWLAVELDLSAYSGQHVDLVFETRRQGNSGGRAAWSSPVLRGTRDRSLKVATPILAWRVERDLLGDAAPPIGLGTLAYAGRGNAEEGAAAHSQRVKQAELAAGTPRDPTSPLLHFRIEVPPDGALELAGEVVIGPDSVDAPLGPATFRVMLDGRPLAVRTIGTERKIVARGKENQSAQAYEGLSFLELIPLGNYAGQTLDLSLEIDNSETDDIAWWTRLLLVSSKSVVRRRAGEGPNVLVVMINLWSL